jgi:hypothetical protein
MLLSLIHWSMWFSAPAREGPKICRWSAPSTSTYFPFA